MSLPFELPKYYKRTMKNLWRTQRGLLCTDEEFEEIYDKYIHCSQCELCGFVFEKSRKRHMDHCHKTGKFRNVVCVKCNGRKIDNKSYGSVDERNITKSFNKRSNKYVYTFKLVRDDKLIVYKTSIHLEKVIKFKDEWFKANPEYFS